MAKNRGIYLGLAVVIVAAAGGFAYYRTQQGASQTPPAPPSAEAESKPASGRYVALGDSYTSSPRTGKPAGDPPGCARSDNNYPHLVAAKISPAEFVDVSCSAAVTDSITGPQKTGDGTNPAQLEAVTAETTLVTLGIGGNDVGFISFASQCLADNANAAPCKTRFTAGGKDQLATRVSTTGTKVASLLKKIRAQAPKARIVVVGYPTVLPEGNGCWPSLPIGAPDVNYFRDALDRLNRTLAEQAEANGAGFADTAARTQGHDLCKPTGTRWVEGILASSAGISLHPNAKGQEAMAEALLGVLD